MPRVRRSEEYVRHLLPLDCLCSSHVCGPFVWFGGSLESRLLCWIPQSPFFLFHNIGFGARSALPVRVSLFFGIVFSVFPLHD